MLNVKKSNTCMSVHVVQVCVVKLCVYGLSECVCGQGVYGVFKMGVWPGQSVCVCGQSVCVCGQSVCKCVWAKCVCGQSMCMCVWPKYGYVCALSVYVCVP